MLSHELHIAVPAESEFLVLVSVFIQRCVCVRPWLGTAEATLHLSYATGRLLTCHVFIWPSLAPCTPNSQRSGIARHNAHTASRFLMGTSRSCIRLVSLPRVRTPRWMAGRVTIFWHQKLTGALPYSHSLCGNTLELCSLLAGM